MGNGKLGVGPGSGPFIRIGGLVLSLFIPELGIGNMDVLPFFVSLVGLELLF